MTLLAACMLESTAVGHCRPACSCHWLRRSHCGIYVAVLPSSVLLPVAAHLSGPALRRALHRVEAAEADNALEQQRPVQRLDGRPGLR